MHSYPKYLLLLALMLFFSRTVPAQNLPQLSSDSRILQGRLQSGVTYYMVTNTSEKGYADVAVVQKGEVPGPEKRHDLNTAFLSRQGIGPRPEGYFYESDGSTVYRFDHVPFYQASALDSTLLHAFVQVARSEGPQAVIVSGDIDPAEIRKKMDMLSLLVPLQKADWEKEPYVWTSDPAPKVFHKPLTGGSRAEVSAGYASARIPLSQMNTAQALVTDILARELRTVLLHRLEGNLRENAVPYSDIRFQVRTSMDGAGDEQYTVSVVTDRAHLNAAMRVVSSTFSSLAETGADETEFSDARRVLYPEMVSLGASNPSSRDDVDRCVAHFLYGATLVPLSEETRLFTRKNVSDSVSTALFNQFSAAIPRQLENLTLTFTVDDSLDLDRELFQYNLAYLLGAVDPPRKDYTWRSADTLGLRAVCPRVKIKSTKAEPVSNGVIWTFSNGIRVAYKQLPGSGFFSYALLLNGGLAHVDGLTEGEGGFVGDMLSLYDCGGLPARNFRDLLAANGVSLSADVDVNCMALRGKAPRQKLDMVLQTLLSLANDRRMDPDEFAVYAQNRASTPEDAEEHLRFLMHPGFTAASGKRPEALTDQTPRKAERFFESRFSRVNDGMLILCGDLEEAAVRRSLQKYLGGFRTLKGTTSRKSLHYSSLAGSTTYTREGADKSIRILMETEYPLTAVHYLASGMVEEALRRSLVRSLDGTALSVSVKSGFTAQPQERFWVLVTCVPADPAGLSDTAVESDMLTAIGAVRAGIRSAAKEPVTEVDAKAWRNLVLQRVALQRSSPEDVVSQLLVRYGVGKDLVSKYTESIQATDAAKVRQMLEKVVGGGCIEYITY